ncbi:MAG: hypothetical protein ACTHMY_28620 [Solirubrobacteraceae bacterium]
MTTLPFHPCLLGGVIAVERSGSVVLEGGALRHVFRGRDASRVLLRVVRLLDGTTRADEVADSTGLDLEEVNDAIRMLADRGLLAPETAAGLPDDPSAAWLFLNARIQRNERDGDVRSAMARLADAHIGIHGEGWLAELLDISLHACGVGATRLGAHADFVDCPSSLHVMCFTSSQPLDAWNELVVQVGAAGVPVVIAAAAESSVALGPRLDVGNVHCGHCLATQLQPRPPGGGAAGARVRSIAGLVLAPEICRLAADVHADDFRGKFIRIDVDRWAVQQTVLPACVHHKH